MLSLGNISIYRQYRNYIDYAIIISQMFSLVDKLQNNAIGLSVQHQ